MYSRISHDPTFGNHTDKNFHENQLFKLIWEDIKVDKVDFNLDAGKILSSNPITLAEQVLTNHFDSEQQMSFSVSKTVTNTSSFEYGEGFTVSAGLEFIGTRDLFFLYLVKFLDLCLLQPESRTSSKESSR